MVKIRDNTSRILFVVEEECIKDAKSHKALYTLDKDVIRDLDRKTSYRIKNRNIFSFTGEALYYFDGSLFRDSSGKWLLKYESSCIKNISTMDIYHMEGDLTDPELLMVSLMLCKK